MTECVDLRQLPEYRSTHEPEGRPTHKADDPWDLVIRGRLGFVAPCGGDVLFACTNGMKTTLKVLAAAPGAVLWQDGSGGQNVRFHQQHLRAVAAVLGLRKRRRLTEAHRQRLAAASAGYRFPPAAAGSRDA